MPGTRIAFADTNWLVATFHITNLKSEIQCRARLEIRPSTFGFDLLAASRTCNPKGILGNSRKALARSHACQRHLAAPTPRAAAAAPRRPRAHGGGHAPASVAQFTRPTGSGDTGSGSVDNPIPRLPAHSARSPPIALCPQRPPAVLRRGTAPAGQMGLFGTADPSHRVMDCRPAGYGV